ncbi:Uncharacterised protein [Bordetella pertussis]|nr:Uncharacterised protein [Bordetella pertussis]
MAASAPKPPCSARTFRPCMPSSARPAQMAGSMPASPQTMARRFSNV